MAGRWINKLAMIKKSQDKTRPKASKCTTNDNHHDDIRFRIDKANTMADEYAAVSLENVRLKTKLWEKLQFNFCTSLKLLLLCAWINNWFPVIIMNQWKTFRVFTQNKTQWNASRLCIMPNLDHPFREYSKSYSNIYCTIEPVKYRSKIIFLNKTKHWFRCWIINSWLNPFLRKGFNRYYISLKYPRTDFMIIRNITICYNTEIFVSLVKDLLLFSFERHDVYLPF